MNRMEAVKRNIEGSPVAEKGGKRKINQWW